MAIGILYAGTQQLTPFITFGDAPVITNVSGATPTIALETSHIYNCTSNVTSLTVTYPASIDTGFIAKVNFNTGNTFTGLTGTSTVWFGAGVQESGIITLNINSSYSIVFYYDGTVCRGIIEEN